METEKLEVLRRAVQVELDEGLIPFWLTRIVDYQSGGFIGRMDAKGNIDRRAPKGLILNTRLLWTYSALYNYSKDDSLKTLAQRAYNYLMEYFWDQVHGGLFWSLDFKGNFIDAKKKTYGQAFFIYALAEFYKITRDKSHLKQAITFFEFLHEKAHDAEQGGYIETFERNWKEADDLRLSAVDMNEKKSMNTQLHVMEALSNLRTVTDNKLVENSLAELVHLFHDKIIDPSAYHFHLFFDERWTPKSDRISFGHDIEGSWLLVEAAERLGDAQLLEKTKQVAVNMAEQVLTKGVDSNGGIFFEGTAEQILDSDKHWWPQAEAVVGFLNAFQISKDVRFLKAAQKTWSFLEKHIIDKRYGEWFWRVSQNGQPYMSDPKVSEWKSGYHSCRSCLELINRIDQLISETENSGSKNDQS